MDARKKTKIGLIVVSILLAVIAVISGTNAYYNSDTYAKNPYEYQTGTLVIEANSKSNNISLTNAIPLTDEEGIDTEPYVFTIKNTGNVDYQFDVKLLSTSANAIDSHYIKLKVDDNDVTILSTLTDSIIKEDVILKAGETLDVILRTWLSYNTPNTQLGKSFNSKIVIDGQAIYTEGNNQNNTLSQIITNLYLNASNDNKGTVTNGAEGSQIQYNIVEFPNKTNPTWGLINDRLGGTTASLDGGNIRYYGAYPDNYIYFNCTDYSNQSEENCEIWRIIGVFDGKVKLIRGSSIGDYSWDTSSNSVNSGYGANDWTQADLMKLLNPGYENETIGGSLYYNSGNGTCYNGQNNATTTCNFTSIGIKNDITRNLISNVVWNLGGTDGSPYPHVYYAKERGTTVYNTIPPRPTTWTGKIAIAYPTDYGYAVDLNKCNKTLSVYDQGDCPMNNWQYKLLITDNAIPREWLLTPNSTLLYTARVISTTGVVSYSYVSNVRAVLPVLYLNAEQTIKSGDGSSTNPYQLQVN